MLRTFSTPYTLAEFRRFVKSILFFFKKKIVFCTSELDKLTFFSYSIWWKNSLQPQKKKVNKIMNKKHFTLVEVLVVVGIIGILAGLIFPAVGMARQAGRRTECISNQGQLMKLLTVTMNANDSYLVNGSGMASTSLNDTKKDAAWTRYLHSKGKLSSTKGFRCPAIMTNTDPTLGRNPTNSQMAAALGVIGAKGADVKDKFQGFDFRGTKRLTVKSSSTKVILSPSQLVIGGCSGRIEDNELIPRSNLYNGTAGYFFVVHDNELNMFFLDGHVESVTKEQASTKFIPDNDVKYSDSGDKDKCGAIQIPADDIKNFED